MQQAEGLSNNGTHLSRKRFREINDAIRRGDREFLLRYIGVPQVNFSKDPLLSAMLTYGCDKDLMIQMLDKTGPEHLEIGNDVGDTALHVAVAHDQVEVATKMIQMNGDLVHLKNNKGQTPLHKSALFGQTASFRMLIEKRSDPLVRTQNGSNVLHCAIMGNNPELALEIAKEYEDLVISRNSNSLTPLQLMVTIPQAFRSSLHFGAVQSLIYEWSDKVMNARTLNLRSWGVESGISPNYPTTLNTNRPRSRIPLKKSTAIVWKEHDEGNRDVEKQGQSSPYNYSVENEKDFEEVPQKPLTKTNRKLATYSLWMRRLLIYILKKLSSSVNDLEELKNNHAQNLKLVAYLAKDPDYWDFMNYKGMYDTENKRDSELEDYEDEEVVDDESDDDFTRRDLSTFSPQTRKEEMGQHEFLKQMMNKVMVEFRKHNTDKKAKGPTRWHESPLLVGAKMGLYDFVEQILKVCPESAQYKDMEGMNVLQIAIKHGHEKIVKIIIEMTTRNNPVLPSSLLSAQDNKENNTILHYAAETTIDDEGPPMQMFYEIKWFERVQKMVPRDILYSRNVEEKTGQELFKEKHIDMVKSGRQQLMELGKTCAGLMAAVVFASSFSIPGEKDNNHNPVFIHRTAFKVFSHAYVIGLSCAACALVLFLSLLTSNYREQDFQRTLPIKYSLAMMSFIWALLALLVAFTCNIYLNIYGGAKDHTKELFPLIFELTFFPVLCGFVMILGGAGLGVWDFIRNLFR